MIGRPDRVLVWKSQLAASDFPLICAMTGRTADTWRKFSFSTTPPWAYPLYMLGSLGGVVGFAASRRASGSLPLTRSSARRATLVRLMLFGLLLVGIIFSLAGAMAAPPAGYSDAHRGTLAAVLFSLGFGVMLGAIGIVLLRRRALGPTGRIMKQLPGHPEPLVELRNVHPVFAAAVMQHQRMRAAQFAPKPPSPPSSPAKRT